jgi:hypothetical protein
MYTGAPCQYVAKKALLESVSLVPTTHGVWVARRGLCAHELTPQMMPYGRVTSADF